eukprot:GFKZ01006006.1.p1 GENE.GFKZ01006006.1~~GFKZ01006006.1.p1  ORF type:complete len:449 (+),score=66.31 GFKZ01006006.1:1737-3083(+)
MLCPSRQLPLLISRRIARPHPFLHQSRQASSFSQLSTSDLHTISTRLLPLTRTLLSHLQALQAQPHPPAPHATTLQLLSPLSPLISETTSLHNALSDLRTLEAENPRDPELLQLIQDEHSQLLSKLASTTTSLLSTLLPVHHHLTHSTPPDSNLNSAILELRAGTGGDEAALFVNDLHLMYTRLAARHKWKLSPISYSHAPKGGLRELILRVSAPGISSTLLSEAGVHRVQRVPATETHGRMHTSTASVAVLSDNRNAARQIKLSESDIKVDVYRASGAGGQHVNKTESAVRVTHLPTGLVAQSQEERSQHRNRQIAMEVLAARIAAAREAEEVARRVVERRNQLGESTGERSDRIRTYNFPQRRVTDHRLVMDRGLLDLVPSVGDVLGDKSANLEEVMQGGQGLDRLMEGVQRVRDLVAMKEILEIAKQEEEGAGGLEGYGLAETAA